MNKIKSLVLLSVLAVAMVAGADNTTPGGPAIPTSVTNVFSGNGLFNLVNSVLPYWNPDLTNSFAKNELEIGAGAAWKTLNASGLTPYGSLTAERYFGYSFGVGANVIAFNDGSGNSTIDSAQAYLVGRKISGNAAAFGLVGVARDFNKDVYDWVLGGGLEFRYLTGNGLRIAAKYLGPTTKGTTDKSEVQTVVELTRHF